jgi:hypothetical protein
MMLKIFPRFLSVFAPKPSLRTGDLDEGAVVFVSALLII